MNNNVCIYIRRARVRSNRRAGPSHRSKSAGRAVVGIGAQSAASSLTPAFLLCMVGVEVMTMGRLPIYGSAWKQRVYELPLDIGLQVQRASERSGVSADGICRAAIRYEQRHRGGPDLTPWVDPAPRPVRTGRIGRAKRIEAQRQVWRVGVQICNGWELVTDRLGVTGMIIAGVEKLQFGMLDGHAVRTAIGISSHAAFEAAAPGASVAADPVAT